MDILIISYHQCTCPITCVSYPPSYEASWYFRLIRKYCNIPICLKPGLVWYMWYFKELKVVSILRRHSAPSHYLNQCWVIVNGTLRNKLQWNFDQIQKIHSPKCIWKYPRGGGWVSTSSMVSMVVLCSSHGSRRGYTGYNHFRDILVPLWFDCSKQLNLKFYNKGIFGIFHARTT